MTKAIYYHAGCAICVEAERSLLPLLDRKQVNIEVVHLDVLVTEELGARAGEFARRWLAGRGIDEADISQGHCSYCHSEIATAEVAEAIRLHGHYILPLEGC